MFNNVFSLEGKWNRILCLPGTGNIIGDSRARKVREEGGGGGKQLFPVACCMLAYSCLGSPLSLLPRL